MDHPTPGPRRRITGRRGRILLNVMVFAVCLAATPALNVLSAALAHEPWKLFDEGVLAYAAQRVAAGLLPHVHFPYYYGGLFELVLGAWFTLVGASLAAARVFLACILGLSAVALHHLLTTADVPPQARIPAALAGTLIPFGLHFHIFPAWTAGLLLLAAVPLTVRGFMLGRHGPLFLAGLVLGIAACVKQNIGILGFLAVMLSLVALPARRPDTRVGPRMLLSTGVLLAFGVMVWIMGPRSSAGDRVILLTGPAITTVLALFTLWISPRAARAGTTGGPAGTLRLVVATGCGFALGFLAGAAPFILHGHALTFLREAFLDVRDVAIYRSIFDAGSTVGAMPDMGVLRRVAGFSTPAVVGIAGVLLGHRRARTEGPSAHSVATVVTSTVLLVAAMSLYPLALTMYLLYLGPLTAALAVLIVFMVRSPQRKRLLERWTLGVCGAALLGMAWHGFAHSNGVRSPAIPRLGIPLFAPTALEVVPVLETIDSLSPQGRFVGFHRYNLLFAFLLNRPTEAEFGQQHMQARTTRADTETFLSWLKGRGVEAVVISRTAAMTLPGGIPAVDSLLPHHRRVRTTGDALVYILRSTPDTALPACASVGRAIY